MASLPNPLACAADAPQQHVGKRSARHRIAFCCGIVLATLGALCLLIAGCSLHKSASAMIVDAHAQLRQNSWRFAVFAVVLLVPAASLLFIGYRGGHYKREGE